MHWTLYIGGDGEGIITYVTFEWFLVVVRILMMVVYMIILLNYDIHYMYYVYTMLCVYICMYMSRISFEHYDELF